MKKIAGIKIVIGRFGSSPEEVTVSKDSSIKEALDQAGISINGSDKIYVGGESARLNDILEEGDVVNIVSPKEAGC